MGAREQITVMMPAGRVVPGHEIFDEHSGEWLTVTKSGWDFEEPEIRSKWEIVAGGCILPGAAFYPVRPTVDMGPSAGGIALARAMAARGVRSMDLANTASPESPTEDGR